MVIPMKKACLFATCALLMSACSMSPSATYFDLTMKAAPDLNPDLTSRPSPMVLRLVEMKSHTAFENADYLTLASNLKATLGPDYVADETMAIRPGEEKHLQLKLHNGSRYVGVIAEYRALDKAQWRYVLEPTSSNDDIHLDLTSDAIKLVGKKK